MKKPIWLSEEMWQRLRAAACVAREHAYAPFSKFHVGAAILTSDGHIYSGCNVENASYGLTNCGERTAIFTAVAANARMPVLAVVIVAGEGKPAPPCGACRQVIYEFGPDAVIMGFTANLDASKRWTIRELLPDAFRADDFFQPEPVHG